MTDKAKQNLGYTLSTHAAEYMTPSKEAMRLCKDTSEGRITANAAVKLIQQKYGVEGRRTNG